MAKRPCQGASPWTCQSLGSFFLCLCLLLSLPPPLFTLLSPHYVSPQALLAVCALPSISFLFFSLSCFIYFFLVLAAPRVVCAVQPGTKPRPPAAEQLSPFLTTDSQKILCWSIYLLPNDTVCLYFFN